MDLRELTEVVKFALGEIEGWAGPRKSFSKGRSSDFRMPWRCPDTDS